MKTLIATIMLAGAMLAIPANRAEAGSRVSWHLSVGSGHARPYYGNHGGGYRQHYRAPRARDYAPRPVYVRPPYCAPRRPVYRCRPVYPSRPIYRPRCGY